jgi:hypothetical protein
MKKRVKVYKAENGQGAYMSNLAKFMQKAQMGGQPTMEQMSYPGDQQGQEGQQMDQDQVINMIAMDITNGRPKEETMAKLTNIVGLDFQTADQFFEGVRAQINNREEEVEEESVEEEATPPDPSGNLETVEKQEEEEGPSNNDIAYQDALNDDSDEAVMEGDVEGMFQMGGDVSEDFGDEYPVTLPDVSAYLPSDMYNFWDPQNPAAQIAFSDQMYMNPTQQEVDSSYTEMPEEPQMAKYGGYKKEKKTYVNAILKANRKQMGGDAVSEESEADATGQNYRTAKLKGFVGILKNNATESLLREQAEQQFDQMMQMGGMEQDVENPMHHLEAFSNATGNIFNEDMNQIAMAQRGGFLQRLRDRNQQAPNMGFMQRRGFMNPMMPIESIDVRRSGRLFGRPKEYTVTFGPPTLPGGANGAYPGAFYGYGAGYSGVPGTTKKVTTKGTIINEAAKTVNQEASKEVAKNTPESEATQKSAESTNQAEGTTTTNTGGGGGSATTTTNQTQQPVAPKVITKPVVTSNVKRDKWGRPEGDKWYGFNPATKRYEAGPNVKPLDFRTVNATPGLSNVQQGVQSFVAPKSRDEAIAVNQQYFENQRANWLQPQGMLVDVNANPIGKVTEEDVKRAKQNVAIKQEADKVKKGDTSGLSNTQIIALRLNYSRPGEAAKLKKSNPSLYKTLFGQEEGGVVDFDQLQNMEYLQRFIYGGNEDPSLSYINQADMDYTNSKDVTDPYFQYGGVNQITGIRDDRGQQMQGYVRPDGTYIKDITVNKTGMFGRPKQYSVTYGLSSEGKNPTAAQFSLNKPADGKDADTKKETPPQASTTNTDTRTNTEGLDFKSARAIRKGERQTARQTARGERKFGNAEEAAQQYYRDNPMETIPTRKVGRIEANPLQPMPLGKLPSRVDMPQRNFVSQNPMEVERQRNLELFNTYMSPGRYSPQLTANQLEDFSTLSQNPSGLPDYGSMPQTRPNIYRERQSTEPSGTSYENYLDFYNSGYPTEPGMAKEAPLTREQFFNWAGRYDDGGFIGANPVVYTDNPALVGQSNVDMITLNPGIQGAQGQVNWADLNNNRGFNLNQPQQYTQDPNQINSDQAQRAYSGDVTVDVRNRLSNDQLQAGMNLANAGIRGITGMKNKMDDARIAQDFYDNFTSDNIYASDPSKDVGDYSEAGLYQPSAQGQVWGSRSKQYGGDISFGEDPDYVEGDEVYMTDDEIRQYMANGGQVEYL